MTNNISSILIKKGSIINGTGKNPFVGNIFINNGKIENIGDEIFEAEHVIEADGSYILPGMIDCHVHVMINEYNMMQHIQTPFSLNFFKSIQNLKDLLHAGITTARDAGGADLGVKRAIELSLIEGPKLKITIVPLTTTGGHMDAKTVSGNDVFILNPPYIGSPLGIVDGIEEVRKSTREILRAGADVIKVCATGGVMGAIDDPEFTQFTIDELKVMVEEGKMRKGVKVMAHAQGTEGIKNAIKAGVNSIEHGIFLDDEAIELMKEHGTYLVPTLLAIHSAIQGNYPENVKETALKVYEVHKKNIVKAYKAGVKIAMGTDSGIMKHGRNLEELKLMVDIGLSPMEAIIASTKTAAECLGIEKETGTLEIGKCADILILNQNPLENITVFTQKETITNIIQNGKLVK